jgi:hypothetical protein
MATPKTPKGSEFSHQKGPLGSSPVHLQNPDFDDFWPKMTFSATPGRPPKTAKTLKKSPKNRLLDPKFEHFWTPFFDEIFTFFENFNIFPLLLKKIINFKNIS